MAYARASTAEQGCLLISSCRDSTVDMEHLPDASRATHEGLLDCFRLDLLLVFGVSSHTTTSLEHAYLITTILALHLVSLGHDAFCEPVEAQRAHQVELGYAMPAIPSVRRSAEAAEERHCQRCQLRGQQVCRRERKLISKVTSERCKKRRCECETIQSSSRRITQTVKSGQHGKERAPLLPPLRSKLQEEGLQQREQVSARHAIQFAAILLHTELQCAC